MDIINVLHDNRLVDRYGWVMEELIKCGISKYRIWDAVIEPTKTTTESVNAGLKQIVQYAKEKGHRECVIWEDDVTFPNKNGWKYFLDNKPKYFDIYIGGSYLIDVPEYDYTPPLVKVKGYVGNHCIIIAEKYYDTFLSSPPTGHIDSDQDGKGDFYVCFPYAALQRPCISGNNGNQLVNWNVILPEGFVYL